MKPKSLPDPFSFAGKIVILRLNRLGHLPPALYATELLQENGFPLLVIEYGEVKKNERVHGKLPRLRLCSPLSHRLPSVLKASCFFLSTLIKITSRSLRSGRPALFVAHGLQEQCLALCLRYLLGVRYVVHVHEAYNRQDLKGLSRFLFRFEKIALRKAEFLIFPERVRRDIYLKRYGFNAPTHIVFNCPRLRNQRNPLDLRKRLNLPEQAQIMLYIGGIGDNNAIREGVQALQWLPEVHLLLAGWCDSQYRTLVEKTAVDSGVSSRVHWLGQLGENKWEYLDSSDVAYCIYKANVLRTTHGATASNKFMEAMAAGLPVIALANNDFRPLVEGYDVGICADSLEPTAIARAIGRMLSDPGGYQQKRKNAFRLHQTLWNYEDQFKHALRAFAALVPSMEITRPAVLQKVRGREPENRTQPALWQQR